MYMYISKNFKRLHCVLTWNIPQDFNEYWVRAKRPSTNTRTCRIYRYFVSRFIRWTTSIIHLNSERYPLHFCVIFAGNFRESSSSEHVDKTQGNYGFIRNSRSSLEPAATFRLHTTTTCTGTCSDAGSAHALKILLKTTTFYVDVHVHVSHYLPRSLPYAIVSYRFFFLSSQSCIVKIK